VIDFTSAYTFFSCTSASMDSKWGGGVTVFNVTFYIFCYVMTVSFIGGGNWSTGRKPPTCPKSLTNFK
jgi:hypothetical protein